MRTIDLNSDLGELENNSLDAEVMPYISSCNIACGGHAGNAEIMRRTVRLAKEHGVAIGAHPGYPDRTNFGRVSLDMDLAELCDSIRTQILLLKNIVESEGAVLRHVKFHGALYNDLSDDHERSLMVCKMIASIDPSLRIIGFSGSEFLKAAEDAGLVAVHEVFADRAYTENGKLVPRSQPGAVLHDEADCLAQAQRFMSGVSGLIADSICVHGDNPSAVRFVSNLRTFFKQQNIKVGPAGDLSFSFSPLGDRSLLARLPSRISKSTHLKIRALQLALEEMEGVVETVPCYAELKIDYNPSVISTESLQSRINALVLRPSELPASRLIEVPVVYDGADLAHVAEHNGLSEQEVIQLHSQGTYRVYMLGFSPGFPYLGGLNPKLATPRLEIPRTSVPAGSVGIAGNQTGIYPVESAGGWNIIGRTSLKLFDPDSEKPFLFEAGDELRFVPVVEEGKSSLSAGPLNNEASGCVRTPSPERFVSIIESGMYATVQDAGRPGWLRYGLPPGGAMDRGAFEAANVLLGNDPNAAVFECTGTIPVLEFSEPTKVAVVYADRFQTMDAPAGEPVRFQPLESGFRAYIAFECGIDVPVVMGSRSTYVPGQFGGFEGRVLRAGDVIALGGGAGGTPAFPSFAPPSSSRSCPVVRVVPGPEANWFDCGGLNTFLTESFAVSAKSDRTGIRLGGTPLSFCHDEQMVSSGIAMGTIQVPPSGLPIIMMADHPTTGGYPRIGNVVEDDLSILAQLKPGDEVRFVEMR